VSTLDKIVARKRADVAARMERFPYDALRGATPPTERRFAEALKKPGARFILECKKASPSEGLIRKNFNMAEITDAYRGVADAVSVLTDEPYFQGSFEYLREARKALPQPILAKDFVTCPYQVCEARFHGADAVLLMLSVLDDETYAACAAEAKRLSMDALTEVHDEAEMDRALRLGAGIVGINNRNLRTLKVDLSTYPRLAAKAPRDKILVCESGIGSREDVLKMLSTPEKRGTREKRADAFLVGGLLMKAENIGLAARRLVYGGVKICGLTSPADAVKAHESGASFGGVVFAGESPRRVDLKTALAVRGASPMPMVGVFVNEAPAEAARLASSMGLFAVQLHGEETGDYIAELRNALPKECEIWKAVKVREGVESVPAVVPGADRALFDSFSGGARGGTGKSFGWSILKKRADRQWAILAGGITPDNALEASSLGCYAIDVNSGVEDAPGKKNHEKIGKLFENLRGGV
jgi:indole-3-glycerol phosphate synthase/phosphoribosylanthranilate isomerase